MFDTDHTGVGPAWLNIATEFAQVLKANDPEARVYFWIDSAGLLRLEARTRVDGLTVRRAARQFEAKATTMCEMCAGTLRHVRSGPDMAIFLCADCADHSVT